jgi:hypothetical protein
MKNPILILIAICLIVAAIPCKTQDETKHTAVFNQQWLCERDCFDRGH